MNEANEWDRIYSSEGRRAEYPDEFVVRFVNRHLLTDERQPEDLRVLDIGCGPGRHVAYLAREGFETYGIDYSGFAIEMAEELCNREGFDAEIKKERIEEMSFENGFFDCVIDCATIQHNFTEEIQESVEEVHRVLKTGGTFFWMARAQADSFYSEGTEEEPGTCVFHQKSVVTDKDAEKVEKPTHFFEEAELREILDDFGSVTVEYTERTFNEMSEKIAHYIVVAQK
jgi:2-polyprenyl-3-methyl-5-hydroxy-6-metoxy-1,4-benzoquinol methylase